jgi:hypothetical protein
MWPDRRLIAAQSMMEAIKKLRALTSKPFNVNFFCHTPASQFPPRRGVARSACRLITASWGSMSPRRRPVSISRRSVTLCVWSSKRQDPMWSASTLVCLSHRCLPESRLRVAVSHIISNDGRGGALVGSSWR